jgi:hypothetical protein
MTRVRIKWQWIAGIIFLFFFIGLLSVRLNLFHDSNETITEKIKNSRLPDINGFSPREAWLSISQKGQKIGYAHRSFAKTLSGYRFSEFIFMRINTMGITQGISFKTQGDLKPDMTPSNFNFELQSSLFQFAVDCVVKGNRMILYVGAPGSKKKVDIVLKEVPRLVNGLLESVWSTDLKPGHSKIFYVFDPATMAQRPVKVTFEGEEIVPIMGQKQKAKKMSLAFMGIQQFAWVGDDGNILKEEENVMGITLEQVTPKIALENLASSASADLLEIVSIPSNEVIGDPPALKTLKLRLANVGNLRLAIKGGRQTFDNNVLTITKESLPPPSFTFSEKTMSEYKPFLKAAPLIQSDHPQMVTAASKIVSHDDPPVKKAQKLVTWVYNNVQKRPVLSVPDALEILKNRVGDCNEHAILLAALARTTGIPSQIEAGIVYQKGRFYYHAWNVLFLGNWVTADATFNQFPADVTHIRFIRGLSSEQVDLLGIIGKVRLEILEKSL